MQLLAVFLSASLAMAGAPPADTKIPTPPTDPSEADVERSHALYENGFKLYQEGSYDEAIVAFRSAYALSGEPTLLYNLALAAERAGDYDMALEYLQAYRVFAKPEEAEDLAQKAESFRKRKLNQESSAASSGSTEGSGAAGESATDEPSPRDEGPADAGKEPKLFGPVAIVFTAVAGASLATALGLGLAARARNKDAEEQCRAGGSGRLCSADAEDDLRSSKRMALGADIMIGIGSAAVLGLVVVLATNAARRKKARRSNVAVLPSSGGVVLHF